MLHNLATCYVAAFPVQISLTITSCIIPLLRSSTIFLEKRFSLLAALVKTLCHKSLLFSLFNVFDDSLSDLLINPFHELLLCLETFANEVVESENRILRFELLRMVHDISMCFADFKHSPNSSDQVSKTGVLVQTMKLVDTQGIHQTFSSLRHQGVPSFGSISLLSLLLNQQSPSTVGEFLGGTTTANLAPDQEAMRQQYFRTFSFPQDDVVQSMRMLLSCSGFSLPPETQQIERILHSFSACILLEQNRHRFRDADCATIIAYMLLLHNTSCHNPKLRIHDRVPVKVFVESIQNTGGCYYSEEELISMYDDVVAQPFAPLSASSLHLERLLRLSCAKLSLHERLRLPLEQQNLINHNVEQCGTSAMFCRAIALASPRLLSCFRSLSVFNDMRSIVYTMNGLKYLISAARSVDMNHQALEIS
eukprot:CRZ05721.1 hypothetical protein [Spongospora subterranea]